jgi:hypothetical protein
MPLKAHGRKKPALPGKWPTQAGFGIGRAKINAWFAAV